MNKLDLIRLTTDELWKVYETITETLAERILAEKQELDSKLLLLQQQGLAKSNGAASPRPSQPRQKRKYPKVLQKYWNPHDRSQTWSGRGKQPIWVTRLIRSGSKLDDLVMPEYKRMTKRAA